MAMGRGYNPRPMSHTARLTVGGALLLVALIVSSPAAAQPATTQSASEGDASADVLRPAPNLHADGVPPIPRSVVEDVARYTDFRTASFQDWHPTRREMLIETRFADVPQVHR